MRYVTFIIPGTTEYLLGKPKGPASPPVTVRLTEQANGTVLVETSVQSGKADLRGLFFDVNDPAILRTLQATGVNLTAQQFGDERVTDLGKGVNMRGSGATFDAGVAFGTETWTTRDRRGPLDDISSASFTLSSATRALTLDDFALTEFGVRMTAVEGINGVRYQEAKNVAIAPAAPNAINDSVQATEDTRTTFLVLANDTDRDNVADLRIVKVSDPVHGTATIAADGKSVIYTPDANYSGTDSFTYDISDGKGGGDSAVATIAVAAVADAPTITLTTAPGTAVNQFLITVSAAVTDADGSEFIDRFAFGGLPTGASITGVSGAFNPAGEPGTLTQTFTVVLPTGVSSDFDLSVTAIAKEKSNADEEGTGASQDVLLEHRSTTVSHTFRAEDQSLWSNGDEFTFTDDRFLGFEGSGSGGFGGLLYGNGSASIKAGFQSTLTFEGGGVDAWVPYDITVDSDYNHVSDMLLISSIASLLDGGGFSTLGPRGSYVLDFIFEYAIKASFGIDIEVDSYDLFSIDTSGKYRFNILDLSSEDIGISYDLPPPLDAVSIDLAWPTLNTNSSGGVGSYTSSGASNNFLQLNVDVDTVLFQILNKLGIPVPNVFQLEVDLDVVGASFELLDLDLSAGLNFLQQFSMAVQDLTGTLLFEDGYSQAWDFSDVLITNASSHDADGDGIIEYSLILAPNATFTNSTDLGVNVGYTFDVLKGEAWYDVLVDSGSVGFGPIYRAQDTLPLGSIELYNATFDLDFASATFDFAANGTAVGEAGQNATGERGFQQNAIFVRDMASAGEAAPATDLIVDSGDALPLGWAGMHNGGAGLHFASTNTHMIMNEMAVV